MRSWVRPSKAAGTSSRARAGLLMPSEPLRPSGSPLCSSGSSALVHDGSPKLDGFHACAKAPPSRPGMLLRSEPFSREVPSGARGWRILYTTRTTDGRIETASGLVVAPTGASRPAPVILRIQRRFVESLRAAGQLVDYLTYSGRDLVSLLAAGSLSSARSSTGPERAWAI